MKTTKIKLGKPKLPFKGATIEYHNKITSFDPKDLSLHLEPEQKNGGSIKGTALAERLKETSPNASVLDYLVEHPELFPEEWKGKHVYFWGTIFRSSVGRLCVRYLYWRDGRWVSGYDWLDGDWRGFNPAAPLASSTQSSKPTTSLDPLDFELRLKNVEETLEKIKRAFV